jgi:hypothetical protein
MIGPASRLDGQALFRIRPSQRISIQNAKAVPSDGGPPPRIISPNPVVAHDPDRPHRRPIPRVV